ncbi:hypothetical protein J4558_08275 [Leptolyngbya sp. 15MV]|nr:hypothetical protein J4558_08275 [Leptolyngbya sp. 15MV]
MNSLLIPVLPAPAPTGGARITVPPCSARLIIQIRNASTASGLTMYAISRNRRAAEFGRPLDGP